MKYNIEKMEPDLQIRQLKRERWMLMATCILLLLMLMHVSHLYQTDVQGLSNAAYQVLARGDGDGL